MADQIIRGNSPHGLPVKFKDMGDGSFADVVSASGGPGGGGASGDVTAAGVSGTTAQAVQGITGGVPVPTSSALDQLVINGKLLTGGARDKWRDSFETLDATKWDYVTGKNASDAIVLGGNTTASGFVEVCLNAMAAASFTEVKGLNAFAPPYRVGYGASVSQRQYGELAIVSISEVDSNGNRVIAPGETEGFFGPNLTISKISITSNVAVIAFTAPHDLKFDDLVVISGAADNRFNVQARVTQIRSKYAITIPLTYTNGNYALTATLNKIIVSKGSANCAGFVYMDNLSANAVYFSRGQGSPEFLSANASFGTSYTDALIPTAQPYAVNLQPRFMTEMVGTMDLQRWMSSPIDSLTSIGSSLKRTQAVPDPAKDYAMFFDVVALPNRAAPIEILSVVKTGTTTATVTTVNPHGLQTGAYVYGYGSRDQTTLANLTSQTSVTVTGPNTLTLAWGTAVTATYYGGMLIPAHGGYTIPGALNTAIMGTAWYNGRLYLGTYVTTPFSMGDVVRLIGVKDATGTARPNMGGRFRVVAINPNVQEAGIATGASTTISTPTVTMTETGAVPFGGFLTGTGLAANSNVAGITANTSITVGVNATATGTQLQDIALTGVVLEPLDFVAPANDQPLTLISMGAIYRETTLRMNFARCLDYTRTPVELTGSHNTQDTQQALPVTAPSSLAVSAAQSTAGSLGTNGTGAWIVRSGATRTVDVASAAITATSTSSAIDVTANNGGVQYTFDATAVGATTRMYPRVQESFDGGTNWVTTFDLPPVVNSTDKTHHTPVLPTLGTHVRYVRAVTGTSPTITNSVTRTSRPMENPPNRRQLVDRVVSLTATTASTDFLWVDGCRKGQIVLALGAATTAPTLKLQVCDDLQAAAWYDVPSATVAGTASTTVASAIFDLPPAKFARLVPTVAGSGITADTYTLMVKAWE